MAFDFFDVNKDGVITIDELTKMFANPSTVVILFPNIL
jgi:Ca2+-binding EF-hand superfamily protein